MKKTIMAALVIFTLLISSVVCSAANYSTTVTCTTEGVAEVTTQVTDLTAGTMVTYLLYGPGTTAEDGTISATTANPDENNILYIDQNNGDHTGTVTFTAKGIDFTKVAGSKSLVGNNASLPTSNVVLDNSLVTYKLAFDEVVFTNITNVVVSYRLDADDEPITYTITDANKTADVYVPIDTAFEITVNPVKDYKVAESGISIADTTHGTVSGNVYTATWKNGIAANSDKAVSIKIEEDTSADAGKVLFDSNKIDNEPVNIDGKSLPAKTFVVTNKTEGIIYLDIAVKNGSETLLTFEKLSTMSEKTVGIQLVDTTGLNLFEDGKLTFELVAAYTSNAADAEDILNK